MPGQLLFCLERSVLVWWTLTLRDFFVLLLSNGIGKTDERAEHERRSLEQRKAHWDSWQSLSLSVLLSFGENGGVLLNGCLETAVNTQRYPATSCHTSQNAKLKLHGLHPSNLTWVDSEWELLRDMCFYYIGFGWLASFCVPFPIILPFSVYLWPFSIFLYLFFSFLHFSFIWFGLVDKTTECVNDIWLHLL